MNHWNKSVNDISYFGLLHRVNNLSHIHVCCSYITNSCVKNTPKIQAGFKWKILPILCYSQSLKGQSCLVKEKTGKNRIWQNWCIFDAMLSFSSRGVSQRIPSKMTSKCFLFNCAKYWNFFTLLCYCVKTTVKLIKHRIVWFPMCTNGWRKHKGTDTTYHRLP